MSFIIVVHTILVIDDDQLRISFSKLLKEENYAVISAASGEAGIEIIEKNFLDLVILDMRLPGINGMETFKHIKKIDSNLPVLPSAISGKLNRQMAAQCFWMKLGTCP